MISKEFQCNVVSISCINLLHSKFPCAIIHVYDVICYFIRNHSKFDFDKNNVMVFGSSISANFVAGATMLDRDNKTNYIKTQILNYPCLDLATNQKVVGESSLLLPYKYVNDLAELKNPYVSPIYASEEFLANMPKTIIISGEKDLLREEDEKYANMLKKSGSEVYYKNYTGMEHGFVELYFLLKQMPMKDESVSNNMKESFRNGLLYKTVMSAIQFIKEHSA